LPDITYRVQPELANAELNKLFGAAWAKWQGERDFAPVLVRSLTHVAAFDGPRLVGFVNVAWDGGLHGFLLDTTVLPDYQRRGIGRRLVKEAAAEAADRGLEWLHVDFEPAPGEFYRKCGFRPTDAGLLDLTRSRGASQA
jgi:GNAT superfamily N-acetyltransferase